MHLPQQMFVHPQTLASMVEWAELGRWFNRAGAILIIKSGAYNAIYEKF